MAVPRHLTALLDHVATVERTLSADHGPLDLFALVRRLDAHRWDVVAAAAWLDAAAEPIRRVADALKSVVGGDGMIDFSRVVILPPGSDSLADLRAAYPSTDGRRRLRPAQYGRVDVADGFLLRHDAAEEVPPPARLPSELKDL